MFIESEVFPYYRQLKTAEIIVSGVYVVNTVISQFDTTSTLSSSEINAKIVFFLCSGAHVKFVYTDKVLKIFFNYIKKMLI